jgi:hypothetical protein
MPTCELASVSLSKHPVYDSNGEILDYTPVTGIWISGTASNTKNVRLNVTHRRILVGMVIRVNPKDSANETAQNTKKTSQKKAADTASPETRHPKFALLVFVIDAELTSTALGGNSCFAEVTEAVQIELDSPESSFEIGPYANIRFVQS